MANAYRASITMTIYPDENGMLEWEDEDGIPRDEQELINYAREEIIEAIYNGVKYNELYDMVDVEIVNDSN